MRLHNGVCGLGCVICKFELHASGLAQEQEVTKNRLFPTVTSPLEVWALSWIMRLSAVVPIIVYGTISQTCSPKILICSSSLGHS